MLLRVVVTLVHSWVWLYALGLSSPLRVARIACLRSDVAEQISSQRSSGRGDAMIAASVLVRCLAGMPSDIAWRFETASPALATSSNVNPTRPAPGIPVAASAACGVAWAFLLVSLVVPTQHSLAYAGGLIALVGLLGWVLEAREDDLEARQVTSSIYPLPIAAGVAAIAAGLVVAEPRASLVVTVPLACMATMSWLRAAGSIAGATSASQVVSPAVLSAQSNAGAAIAIEMRGSEGRFSRRQVLGAGLWLGFTATAASIAGGVVDFLWQRNVKGFGGPVTAGKVTDLPPGTKTKIAAGRFWMVSLTEEQGGPGLLALWQKCPHLGCTVPWDASYTNDTVGLNNKGYFVCPCHQSTYNDAGVRVFGPAPRSMDRMKVTIDPSDGTVVVDTGSIQRGTTDNAKFAVPVDDLETGTKPA